jgi:hypothetical protein
MQPSPRPRLAALAVASVAFVASAAAADDAIGPELGHRRYLASIDDAPGAPDMDPYHELLAAGERITVRVAARPRSDLVPEATLRGPSGQSAGPFTRSRNERRLLLKGFEVPETGLWVLSVSGQGGSDGAYSVRTRVRAAKPIRDRGRAVGGAQEQVDTTFDALDGSLLRLVLGWSRRGDEVRLLALADPTGGAVPGETGDLADETVKRGRRKVAIRNRAVTGGDGKYTVTVGVDPGASGECDLTIRVRSPKRPGGRVVLEESDDPVLDAFPAPVDVREGEIVRVEGANLGRDHLEPPTVRIGEATALVWAVDREGGTFVEVFVPPLPTLDAVYDLTLVNPGGQSATSAAAFRFRDGGAPLLGEPRPDFRLVDVNPASATSAQAVSPRDRRGLISAWYFGRST